MYKKLVYILCLLAILDISLFAINLVMLVKSTCKEHRITANIIIDYVCRIENYGHFDGLE